MRRFWKLLALIALAAMLASCAPLVDDDGGEPQRVYATFYPIYALSALAFEGVPDMELMLLVSPQDGCLRNYALSDRDAYLLQHSADAVIAGGRGLESFESALYALGDAGPAVIAALNNRELYNQDDTRPTDDEEVSHLVGPNPHLYMSVDGAKVIVEAVAIYMTELDPGYAERYHDNADAAGVRLDALKAEMADIAADAAGNSVILMNEALIYLANDLNLTVAGQFDRESGETEDSSDIEDCLEEISGIDARIVLIERQAPQALVEALIAAGYGVAKIDVLSTGRADMGSEGYFAAQRENARAIARALEYAEGAN